MFQIDNFYTAKNKAESQGESLKRGRQKWNKHSSTVK